MSAGAQKELSELIGLVYESAFEVPQWKSLIERISTVFPGVGAAVHGHDGKEILAPYLLSQSASRLGAYHFGALSAGKEQVGVEMLSAPNGYVARSKKYYPNNSWLETEFYQHYMKPAGFKHVVYLKLDSVDRRGAFVGFALPADPAAEDEIHDRLFELLKLLSPHVVRAFHLSRSLGHAQRQANVLGGLFDSVILPAFVADERGRYLFGNIAATRVLERGRPISLDGRRRLKFPDSTDDEAILKALAEQPKSSGMRGLQVQSTAASFSLAIAPFQSSVNLENSIDKHLLGEEQLFAIFLGYSTGEAVNVGILQDIFGLTVREAEVCKLLILGNTAQAIAGQAGRSLRTIRNQTQIIYEKVGVSSNIELVERLNVFRTIGEAMECDPSP